LRSLGRISAGAAATYYFLPAPPPPPTLPPPKLPPLVAFDLPRPLGLPVVEGHPPPDPWPPFDLDIMLLENGFLNMENIVKVRFPANISNGDFCLIWGKKA
jgi:hypothetical protein